MGIRHRVEQGAVVIEALIVTSALLLLLAGLLSYSRGFMEYESLLAAATAGARAAAHYGVTAPSPVSSSNVAYTAYVASGNYLSGAGLDPAQYQVKVSGAPLSLAAQGGTVSGIRVELRRKTPAYFGIGWSGVSLRTRAAAIMRIEGGWNLGTFVHTYGGAW